MTDLSKLAAELETGLEGIPQGPWLIAGARHIYNPGEDPKGANICSVGEPRATSYAGYTELELGSKDGDEAYRIANHLARCSPDNIRALLSERTALLERVEKAEQERDEAINWTSIVERHGTGQFDDLAEAWLELDAIKRTVNAACSTFAKWANEDLMNRFRKNQLSMFHLAYVEGCLAGVKAAEEKAEALSRPSPRVTEWETFQDKAYYDMWCVRPKGAAEFGGGFHLIGEQDAKRLVALLSAHEDRRPAEASLTPDSEEAQALARFDAIKDEHFASVSAMLTEGERPRVKALEWEGDVANTSIGTYNIEVHSDVAYLRLNRASIERCLTVEAAKVAARADFEQRILSALLPSPKAEGEPVGFVSRETLEVLKSGKAGYRDISIVKGNIFTEPLYALPQSAQGWREGVIAGWKACRKSIYAVCEDVQAEAERLRTTSKPGTASEEQHAKGYYSGQCYTAKSIARGFNAMNAEDDNYVRETLAASPSQEGEPG